MKFSILLTSIIILISTSIKAEHVTNWLKSEIDVILEVYKNDKISNIERFQNIENTINKNFAGTGIAKFVAGKAWHKATTETKKKYINLFKRHLALNIASMMKSYTDQRYTLINSKHDNGSDVTLIDMEIVGNTNKLLVKWRIKESKGRFYIIDLSVADISLVKTKRSEFNSMLKKVNYDLEIFNESLSNQNKIGYNKIIN